jgi:hypothetical protein
VASSWDGAIGTAADFTLELGQVTRDGVLQTQAIRSVFLTINNLVTAASSSATTLE